MAHSPAVSTADLAQLKIKLHKRVEKARVEYQQAQNEANKLLETARDVGLRNFEGVLAINRASHLQAVATKRYAEALKALADFILKNEPKNGNGNGNEAH